MPNGVVAWFDPKTGDARVVRGGHEFPAREEDIETAARAAGARVHFDIRRESGVERAANVRLRAGTRVSPHQHRFGDLAGARRPDAAGREPLTRGRRREPGPARETAPAHELAGAWVEAVEEADLMAALGLYAPDALLHVGDETVTGREHVARRLEEGPLVRFGPHDVEVLDEGGTAAVIRWGSLGDGGPGGSTRIRVEHGEIAEQWLEEPTGL